MLQYPSILGIKKVPLGYPCIAFYKYDGSNLRFEWSKKRGWHKYGSRTQMIDRNHEVFGHGIDIFHEHLASGIIERLQKAYPKQFSSLEKITVFAEFYGENSFAGNHEVLDEKHLKIFDIVLFKKGFMAPDEFVDIFGDWKHAAEVVYKGNLNEQFITSVRHNALDIPLNEGVICKGFNEKIKFRTHSDVWMTKIKTFDFINRLKHRYEDNWEQFGE